jgi:hypothetical protein
MKSITNTSLQTFEIYLDYPKGVKTIFLKPHETFIVPSGAISRQCRVLSKRRILTIKSV